MKNILFLILLVANSFVGFSQTIPSIQISSFSQNLIEGQSNSFYASVVNGGSMPILKWKKNGVEVGTNTAFYSDSNLKNGDIISCVLQSSDPNRSLNVVSSNYLKLTILPVQKGAKIIGSGYLGDALYVDSNPSSQVIWKKNGVYFKNPKKGNLGNATILAGENNYQGIQFNSVLGLLVDKANNIYVADYNQNRVLRFSPNSTVGVIVAGGNGRGDKLNQLSGPIAIALDALGNLFVLEEQNNRVTKWEPGSISGIVVAGGNGSGSGANQLNYPDGLTLDAQGNIYIADENNHRIQKWLPGASNGITIAGGNGPGSGLNQLNYPRNVLFNSKGELIIDDAQNYRILNWNIASNTGTVIAGGNGGGSNLNQLGWHYGMSMILDSNDNIFISDSGNNRVLKWTPGVNSGEVIAGGNGYGNSQNQFNSCYGISLDNNGNLFVADSGNQRIQKFTIGNLIGTTVLKNPTTGTVNDLMNARKFVLKSPNEILISQNTGIINWNTTSKTGNFTVSSNDSDGKNSTLSYISDFGLIGNDLYINDQNNNRIVKRALGSTSGSIVAGDNGYGTQSNQLANPNGLEVVNNNLYILNQNSHSVTKWPIGSTSGTRVAGSKGWGSGNDELNNPGAVRIDNLGNTYVLDVNNFRVQKFASGSKNGITVAGGNGSGGNLNQLNYGRDMVIDASGNLYIAREWPNYDVVKWAPGASQGIIVAGGNGQGPGLNQLGYGLRLGIDSNGNLFILDSSNYRVVKWTPGASQGILVAGGNGSGSNPNQIGYSNGLFVNTSGTQLYIADSNNYRIQRWNVGSSEGVTVAGGNGNGNANNQLNYPGSITIDANNNLIIVDRNNFRVQKWTLGATSGTTIFGGNGEGSELNQISWNQDGIIYNNGFYYISDGQNSRILRFQAGDTNAVEYIGQSSGGSGANQLKNPRGFFVSSNETIYVADSDNQRIQKWLPGATTGITVAGGNGRGGNDNQFWYPNAVVVDDEESVYVYDGYYRIQKWVKGATSGQLVAGGNGFGSNLNQFYSVEDLKLDNYNNIYALDAGNNRIVKFVAENNNTFIPTEPGIYTATVTTAWGEFTTANFEVKSTTRVSPTFSISTNSLSIIEGQIVTFTATHSNAGASPLFKWKKNGIEVGGTSNQYTDGTLKDGDIISCILSNTDVSRNFDYLSSNYLKIQVKPPHVVPTLSGIGYPNYKITLNANPTSQVIWKKNGSYIKNGKVGNLGNGIVLAGGNTYLANQFNSILGILLDKAENLYVIDYSNQRVLRFAKNTTTAIVVAGGNGSGDKLNQLNGPIGIALDSQNNVYVVEELNHRVTKWAPGAIEGIVVAGGNGQGANLNQLNYPGSVTIDSQGNIYVSDTNNHRIQKWQPGASNGITIAGGNGAGSSLNQLNNPKSILFNSIGDLIIDDGENYRILKWNLNTNLGTIIAGGNVNGSGNQWSWHFGMSLTLDALDNIYLSDTGNARIIKWVPGETGGNVVAGGNGWGSNSNQLNSPYGIAIDMSGNLLVGDSGNQRIQKFNLGNSTGITVFKNPTTGTVNDLMNARKFVLKSSNEILISQNTGIINWNTNSKTGSFTVSSNDSDGKNSYLGYISDFGLIGNDLYINDLNNYRILKRSLGSTTGSIIAGDNGYGTQANQLASPYGLNIVNNNLFILNQNSSAIVKWPIGASSGTRVAGAKGWGSGNDELYNPGAVRIDNSGNTYVLDVNNFRVQKFVSGSKIGVTVAGGNGNGGNLNQLNYGRDMVLDASGNLYIARESPNFDVVKWTPEASQGVIVAGGNGQGSSLNQIGYNVKLGLDSNGNLYILDPSNYRVVKWTPGASQGILVAGGNGSGSNPNQIGYSNGLYVNSNGTQLFISDSNNNRIQRWNIGSTEGITVAGGNGSGNANNQLSYPGCLTMDASNNLYIVDRNNYRIQKWTIGSSTGSTIFGGNQIGQGSGLNQFSYSPEGIFYYNGSIYLSDGQNSRILKIQPGDLNGVEYVGQASMGSASNQFKYPKGIFVTSDENIYVADSDNNRIQKWLPGATSGLTVAGGNGSGYAENQLNYPNSIYVDKDENIYIADDTDRIKKWPKGASKYEIIVGGNGFGSQLNQIRYVSDLKLDEYGSIYTLDYQNNRLIKFVSENNSTFIPTEPGTYTATITTAWGEFTTADFIVQASPIISATKDIISCGENSTITINGCNGTVKWNTGDLTNSITVNPLVDTQYSCYCTIPSGDVLTLTKLVTINSPVIPSISISSNIYEIIEGSNVFFTANITHAGSNPILEWHLNGKTVGSNSISFNTSSLKEGDQVGCFLKSNAACRTNDIIGSNLVSVKILPAHFTPNLNGGNCIGSELIVKSNPTSQIIWKKDGQIISNQKKGNMVKGEIVLKGSLTFEEGQINPYQIEFDESGNLYILERTEHRILRIKKGENKVDIVAGGNGRGNQLNQLYNPSNFKILNGYLYIADLTNYRVLKWKPGAYAGEIVAGGNGNGSNLDQIYPYGIEIDNQENIYILDPNNDRVLKWAKNATSGSIYLGGNGLGYNNNQMDFPTSITKDKNGDFYILDTDSLGYSMVNKWDKNSNTYTTIYSNNTVDPLFIKNAYINSIKIVDDRLFFADQSNYRVFELNLTTNTFSLTAGGNGFGSNFNQISPKGVALEPNGNIFVADSYRIISFGKNPSNGNLIFGKDNRSWKVNLNQLTTSASAITTDNLGNIFVFSQQYASGSVLFFPKSSNVGTIVAGGNGLGSNLNQLSYITKMIYKDGYLYLLDSNNRRIVKWLPNSSSGEIVAGGNGAGSGLNQFGSSTFDFVMDNNNFIICDYSNNRILKWPFGASQGQIIAGGNGAGVAMNQLYYPNSVAIDNSNNLYIADRTNNRIQKWSQGASSGTTLLDKGTAVNQTSSPTKIFYFNGNLYINDSGNRLINYNLSTKSATILAGSNSNTSDLTDFANFSALDMDNEGNIFGIQSSFDRILKYTFQNNSKLLTDSPGVYSATIKTYWGEFNTNSVNVGSNTNNSFVLKSPSEAVCPGKLAIVNSTGCTGNVTWNTGFVGNSLSVYPQVDTEYFATCQQSTCQVSKSVSVEVVKNNLPLTITGVPDTKRKFTGSKVYSTQKIPSNQENSYIGFNSVELKPGFIVEKGTTFSVNVQQGCEP